MTVSSTVNKVSYTGNNIVTNFAFTFVVDVEAELEVYLDNVLQLSGYTIAGVPGTGSVTFTTPPGSGVIVTLLRERVLTQGTDYTAYDKFPAETHEDALDKLTHLVQQVQEQVARSIQIPKSETLDMVMSDLASARDGNVLSFDASGLPVMLAASAGIDLSVLLASQAQAEAGSNNSAYMSALRVKQAVDFYRAFASQAEAEAGTDGTVVITPLQLQQYIDFHMATQAEAEAGTDNVHLMTALRVDQAITESGLQVATGSISLTAAATPVAITGLGFTPTILVNNSSHFGSTGWIAAGAGVYDGTNNRSVGRTMYNAAGTPTVYNAGHSSSYWYNEFNSSGGICRGNAAFDADGFTVTPNGYTHAGEIIWTAFGYAA